jgi:hypothetical protein
MGPCELREAFTGLVTMRDGPGGALGSDAPVMFSMDECEEALRARLKEYSTAGPDS